MDRRTTLLALLRGSLAVGAWPFATSAQQAGKVRRIGYLSAPTRTSVQPGVDAFLRRLRELGWIEGQNLAIEFRWAEGKVDRLPELAAELVRLDVEVIVAPAASAAMAAKNATNRIPVVMIFPSDPVELGLVASLARPGGNVTGTTSSPSPGIFAKQVQILKETIPNATRIAVLRNPADATFGAQFKTWESAARTLGMRVQYADAQGAETLDAAFAAIARERADALLVSSTSTFLVHQKKIAELALKARLPTMYGFRESVEAGGLMAYAVNMRDFVGHAAGYVDKILKGAKPADLPVEQPTKFELAINLGTAKALGITIPQAVLARADEVIQ